MKFKRNEKCYWEYADNDGWLVFLGVERGWHQFALADDTEQQVWCERLGNEIVDMLTEDEYLIKNIK